MFKIISISEIESMNKSESFLQSNFWACFKSESGWKSRFFSFKYTYKNVEKKFEVATLSRKIKMFASLLYIPMLPNIEEPLQESSERKDTIIENNSQDIASKRKIILAEIAKSLFTFLGKDIFLIRFDPSWQEEIDNLGGKAKEITYSRPKVEFGKVENIKLKKASLDIQPPDTVLLDLTLTLDEITAQFKSKWRYNIRLSEKKGCIIEALPMNSETEIEQGINIFYSLYKTTSDRDGIAIHNKKYYTSLFRLAKSQTDLLLSLYVARYQGKIIASIITLFYKDEGTYLYGASSNENRNVMSTYLLQFKAIMDAKKYGCKVYDFYGMPPIDDPKHPMAGLYRFKTGFGGKIIHRAGSIDSYKNSFIYKIYSLAEALRAFYFKKVKKMFRHRI